VVIHKIVSFKETRELLIQKREIIFQSICSFYCIDLIFWKEFEDPSNYYQSLPTFMPEQFDSFVNITSFLNI